MRKFSFNIYFFVVIILLILTIWLSFGRSKNIVYSQNELEESLQTEAVESVVIQQNSEVPTGVVTVTTKEGQVLTYNVSDVNAIEKIAVPKGISVYMRDVPAENWFLEYVLPALGVLIVCVFFFVMLSNSQNAGGGSGAKMMNFGKSRAQMVEGTNVTFQDVAGLK